MPEIGVIFTFVKDWAPLALSVVCIPVLSVGGFLPRVGPGRAIWIGLRSRFAFKQKPECLRESEFKSIRDELSRKDFGQGYLVITGPKGVGKTCLLNAATNQIPGVIRLKAQPGDNENRIIMTSLKSLTNIGIGIVDPSASAKRVIFWYRFFTLFRRTPIIVISAAERKVGQEYAGLAGAVRTLVDDYKLRVVVDGSPNALDESLLRTNRERVFDIQPMNQNMIWQISQLQDFFKFVDDAGIDSLVWMVLGGIPTAHEKVWDLARPALLNGQDAKLVIGNILCDEIHRAIRLVRNSETPTSDMDEIIKLFDKSKNCIISDLLKAKKLRRAIPDKVFREIKRDGVDVLVPASRAIGIVLRHKLTKQPSLEELEKLGAV